MESRAQTASYAAMVRKSASSLLVLNLQGGITRTLGFRIPLHTQGECGVPLHMHATYGIGAVLVHAGAGKDSCTCGRGRSPPGSGPCSSARRPPPCAGCMHTRQAVRMGPASQHQYQAHPTCTCKLSPACLESIRWSHIAGAFINQSSMQCWEGMFHMHAGMFSFASRHCTQGRAVHTRAACPSPPAAAGRSAAPSGACRPPLRCAAATATPAAG